MRRGGKAELLKDGVEQATVGGDTIAQEAEHDEQEPCRDEEGEEASATILRPLYRKRSRA